MSLTEPSPLFLHRALGPYRWLMGETGPPGIYEIACSYTARQRRAKRSRQDKERAMPVLLTPDTALTDVALKEATMARQQRTTTASFPQKSPTAIARVGMYARVSVEIR